MKIYPRHELRPKYKGESAVYSLLAQVPEKCGFAVHSVNLPQHEYKRWGEVDFVIVEPAGVTMLEVKGGTVTLADREWRYENARGKEISSTEGPARQAISAAVELETLLSRHLGRKVRCRWGVVFPLCNFRKPIAELPPNRLADRRTCLNIVQFTEWLHEIPFDQHHAADFALDPAEIEEIHEILLPAMCAVQSLDLAIRSNNDRLIRLTRQQFGILESLGQNPRLTITGGAGTGKTELAALCARAEMAAGRRPALVTSRTPLLRVLRSRLKPFGIPVVSEVLPSGTDTLIVDEGQDLVQPATILSLFGQLPGGLIEGRWRWFMDPNLQFMEEPPDPDSQKLLQRNSTVVTLTRNVRSTHEIVSVIKCLLDADIGLSDVEGFGIKVRIDSVADVHQETETVVDLVRSKLSEGVHPGSIAVLGPRGLEGPVCAAVAQALPEVLLPNQALSHRPSHGVVSKIDSFRGMEADSVILVDLGLLPAGPRGASCLYIGMTRARASLQLMQSPAFLSRMRQLIAETFRAEHGNERN